MRYFLPRLEVIGKQPVWSMEILPVTSIEFKNAILVRTRGSGGRTDGVIISSVLFSMEGVMVILVDQNFVTAGEYATGRLRAPWEYVCG